MDTIATTKAILDDAWEDPIKFIEANMAPTPTLQAQIDAMRKERDENWNKYQQALADKNLRNSTTEANRYP